MLIGRNKEQEVLQKALKSSEAEMISVIGRRRVGKTFLIKSVYEKQLVFEITGIKNATREEQLLNFTNRLLSHHPNALIVKPPSNWLEAFFLLIRYLEQLEPTEKMVVFFDELPWLDTHKSGFLKGLSFFWNSWAVNQKVVLVICGSAASWMIQKVVNNTGGLYNRLTRRLILKPFTLAETADYLQSRNIPLNHYQIVQLYMTMGGIPHYLKEIEAGLSAIQNIDAICFSDTGILKDEFLKLYPALFENADNHIAVIRALFKKKVGMTRSEVLQKTKLSNGGSLTKVLDELTQSGFISTYRAFEKKKKDRLYRLTDEYSLFYLQFIEPHTQDDGETSWLGLSQTPAYKSWSGYAFESICLKHILQIKKALGIEGLYSTSSSFYKKGNKDAKGVQIDLLIDRNDQVINLVEIKFYNKPFIISKAYADQLQQKLWAFQEASKTNKQLFLVLLTTFGLKENQYSSSLVAKTVVLKDLFEQI